MLLSENPAEEKQNYHVYYVFGFFQWYNPKLRNSVLSLNRFLLKHLTQKVVIETRGVRGKKGHQLEKGQNHTVSKVYVRRPSFTSVTSDQTLYSFYVQNPSFLLVYHCTEFSDGLKNRILTQKLMKKELRTQKEREGLNSNKEFIFK